MAAIHTPGWLVLRQLRWGKRFHFELQFTVPANVHGYLHANRTSALLNENTWESFMEQQHCLQREGAEKHLEADSWWARKPPREKWTKVRLDTLLTTTLQSKSSRPATFTNAGIDHTIRAMHEDKPWKLELYGSRKRCRWRDQTVALACRATVSYRGGTTELWQDSLYITETNTGKEVAWWQGKPRQIYEWWHEVWCKIQELGNRQTQLLYSARAET